MGKYFEELDYERTPLGDLTLSRRRIPMLGDQDVFEIKLNDEFLMSSLFFGSEVALATLGLQACAGDALDVVVGGLGLGFTAAAALDEPRLRSLTVVEYLEPVLRWHREGRVPLGERVARDPKCRLRHGDFFALASGVPEGFGEGPGQLFHAVLLDIDHSPKHHLNPAHAALYGAEGLARLAAQLHQGGVFAMWSNDAEPDEGFMRQLRAVFPLCSSHPVAFPNPIQGGESRCSVYVARKG